MSTLSEFEQIFSELTSFPGNLTFHLVLAFAIAGSLYAAFQHWRSTEYPQARRMVIGLSLLLGIRLVFFLFSGVAENVAVDAELVLPPIDRAITTFSLIWVVWLWAFPEPTRIADTATGLLSLLTLTYLGFSLAVWANFVSASPAPDPEFFNRHYLSITWGAFSIILAFCGMVLVFLRRPNGWAIGFSMMVILLAGHLIHLLFPDFGNHFAGAVRLTQLMAYPLLLTLPQRFPLYGSLPEASEGFELTVERRSYSTEPEAFRAFLTLASEQSPAQICPALTRTISHVMLADLSLLVSKANEEGEIFVECGYDLIREKAFGGTTIAQETLPVLSAALEKGRPLRLPASSTSPDLTGLAEILGLEEAGHLLAAPITLEGLPAVGAVILLSPYSRRGWKGDDQEYLVELTNSLADIARSRHLEGIRNQDLADARAKLKATQVQINDLVQANEELRTQMDVLEQQPAEIERQTAESLAELLEAHEEAQKTIRDLEAEINRLRSATEDEAAAAEEDRLAGELRLAMQEIADLTRALEDATGETVVSKTNLSSIAYPDDDHAEVIVSIAQEIRQPMSSITGYTDLLLSESVGILGTLQIKFLERIKASIERMRSLMDDLIQVTTMESGQTEISPEPVNLNAVIDDAIAHTRSQLRENNIILRVDMPDFMPEIHADRDALQQILIHLLQNAGSVTPVEGEVSLRARVEQEDPDPHILIQVSDSGGGIPPDDLPRVFSRLYRADNALIQGVGDTGVGLALVKALVEAHQGQIWVDTEEGKGSQFTILLPLNHRSDPEASAGGPG